MQKPMVRGTLWDMGVRETRLLAFPYLVYVIGFWQGELAKIYIYYSNSPVTKLQDTLYRTNLPNVYADDSCCLGSSGQFENFRRRISRFSQSQRVERVVDSFWAFRFNGDMTSNCFNPVAGGEPRLSSLEAWERNSRIDKGFILTVSWRRACTVSEAMSRYLSGQYH
jgi:hypothetical protein